MLRNQQEGFKNKLFFKNQLTNLSTTNWKTDASIVKWTLPYTTNIYLFKANNRNTRKPASLNGCLRTLGPNLNHTFFLQGSALPDVRHCPKLQSCAISRKTQGNIEEISRKTLISNPNWGPPNFFLEFYLY